jgi:uncharacterized protein
VGAGHCPAYTPICGYASAGAQPAFVVSLALSGRLRFYVSPPILDEYERVLRYPRLNFQPDQVTAFMRRVRQASTMVHPTITVNKAKDEPDNRFLECAETAAADYLVTGNLRHFPNRWKTTEIVNPRQFLSRFLEQIQH